MNVLVLFAHPQRKSLNGAFLEKTLHGLAANPRVTRVKTVDLYEESFDPILRFGGDIRRRDLYKEPQMEPFRQQLKEADLIVFIYPLWWGRPPAMLLGFFDRVLSSNFAYRYVPGRLMPEGLLKGKRAVCVSTMKGPSGYPALVLGNAHKTLMKKAVLNFIGVKGVKFFEFGGMEKKEGRQTACLKKVEQYMAAL